MLRCKAEFGIIARTPTRVWERRPPPPLHIRLLLGPWPSHCKLTITPCIYNYESLRTSLNLRLSNILSSSSIFHFVNPHSLHVYLSIHISRISRSLYLRLYNFFASLLRCKPPIYIFISLLISSYLTQSLNVSLLLFPSL